MTKEEYYKDREMNHPIFGVVTIKYIRKITDRTLAYFEDTVCNLNILSEIKDEIKIKGA